MSMIRPALVMFILLTLITGAGYPLLITGVAQVAFPRQANGSIVERDGRAVGSALIGQEFAAAGDPGLFWGRPSATGPVPYTSFNGATLTGSSGSNYAPSNPALVTAATARIDALRAADAAAGYARPDGASIPVDLVTASGSGLDPHISIAAAEYQVPRVARARGLAEDEIRAVVRANTRSRQLGVLGEPVVNVLLVNLALDGGGRSNR